MISRDMYRVLKHVPRAPNKTSLTEMCNNRKSLLTRINEVNNLLAEAKAANYIAFSSVDPYSRISRSPFHLTEKGQIGIEEYKQRHLDSRRSLLAIIISVIGLILSTTISIAGLILQT